MQFLNKLGPPDRWKMHLMTILLTVSVIIAHNNCKTGNKGVYDRIREHTDQIRVVNTHEHQQ